jgi:hypothetical protein
MGKWLATSPLGSIVKVFVGTALGGLYLFLKNDGSFDDITLEAVEGFLMGALIVVLPMLINYVNPADTRYGRNS